MMKRVKLVLPIKTSLISLPVSYSLHPTEDFDLQPLKNNIAENGILSPIIIRETVKGKYEAVCGKRRLLCARALGLKTVPCIKVAATSTDAKIMAISETVSSRSPDFFDLAYSLSDLIVNGNADTDTVRYKLGISESYLNSKLDLLKLSDSIKKRVTAAHLTERQATELLRLPSEKRQSALDYIIANQLNEKDTVAFINESLMPIVPKPQKPIRKAAIGDLKLFSNSLNKMLSTLAFAGYQTEFTEKETPLFIDYSIRLKKKADSDSGEFYQMKLC